MQRNKLCAANPANFVTVTVSLCLPQAAEMMRAMPAEQLAEMSRMTGAPAMDPEALAQMQRSMASMSPEQMESMMRMSASMGAAPGGMQDPAAVAKVGVCKHAISACAA